MRAGWGWSDANRVTRSRQIAQNSRKVYGSPATETGAAGAVSPPVAGGVRSPKGGPHAYVPTRTRRRGIAAILVVAPPAHAFRTTSSPSTTSSSDNAVRRRRPTRRSSTAGALAPARRRRGGRRTTGPTPRRSTPVSARRTLTVSRSRAGRPAPSSTASAADFAVGQSGVSGASRFLFATEGGKILGWTPTVNATTAILGVDNSTPGRRLQGSRDGERPPVRDRLPQRPRRRRSTPRSSRSRSRSRTRRSRRAARRSASRRSAATSTSPTRSRTARSTTTSPGRRHGYVDEFTPDGKLVARVARGARRTRR